MDDVFQPFPCFQLIDVVIRVSPSLCWAMPHARGRLLKLLSLTTSLLCLHWFSFPFAVGLVALSRPARSTSCMSVYFLSFLLFGLVSLVRLASCMFVYLLFLLFVCLIFLFPQWAARSAPPFLPPPSSIDRSSLIICPSTKRFPLRPHPVQCLFLRPTSGCSFAVHLVPFLRFPPSTINPSVLHSHTNLVGMEC